MCRDCLLLRTSKLKGARPGLEAPMIKPYVPTFKALILTFMLIITAAAAGAAATGVIIMSYEFLCCCHYILPLPSPLLWLIWQTQHDTLKLVNSGIKISKGHVGFVVSTVL